MSATPARRPLRVSLLGLGTVGRAVARALVERPADLQAAAGGRPIRLVAIGVRDPARDRGVRLPDDVALTDDLASVAAAETADVVIELLGGRDPAGALVRGALGAGRGVVSANKALLAAEGASLEAVARESGSPLRFEAAVGGGIPILAVLARDLAANRWDSIAGIVNGTTNHILSAMTDEGLAYEAVLSDAQARGYAEADPSGDVEGRDAADKLVVLARLAFGGWLPVERIPRHPPNLDGLAAPGITGVRIEEIEAARRAGLTLKLLARASRSDAGVSASVLPTLVPSDSGFGRTGGVENRIELHGEPIGAVAFSGPGAGGPATSSAVLGDLLAIARGEGPTWAGLPPAAESPLADESAAPRRWFSEALGPGADEPLPLGGGEGTRPGMTLYPILEAV